LLVASLEVMGMTTLELVRQRMNERHLTVSALARAVGIARQNVSPFLGGKTTMKLCNFEKVMETLGLRIVTDEDTRPAA
jgi:hypothetical protein